MLCMIFPAVRLHWKARVDRFGRQTQLNIHVLVPSTGVESFAESLESFRHVFGARGFSHDELLPNVQK